MCRLCEQEPLLTIDEEDSMHFTWFDKIKFAIGDALFCLGYWFIVYPLLRVALIAALLGVLVWSAI